MDLPVTAVQSLLFCIRDTRRLGPVALLPKKSAMHICPNCVNYAHQFLALCGTFAWEILLHLSSWLFWRPNAVTPGNRSN